MCRSSRPNYNQHHQSIFVNRHISHAIQRFSRQTTSQKAIPGQGTPLKLPSNLESIFLIQTVGTSRPLPSQRLSHLKQSPKPKSICLHKTSLYRNTSHLARQQTCHGNRSSTSPLFVPLRHLCCYRYNRPHHTYSLNIIFIWNFWNCPIMDQVVPFLSLLHCECCWSHILSANRYLWCSSRFCSLPPSVHSLHLPTQQTNFLISYRSRPSYQKILPFIQT